MRETLYFSLDGGLSFLLKNYLLTKRLKIWNTSHNTTSFNNCTVEYAYPVCNWSPKSKIKIFRKANSKLLSVT